jgi:hypothetical protein
VQGRFQSAARSLEALQESLNRLVEEAGRRGGEAQ